MMFPTVHHREVPYVQGNPHYYPGDILSITISITIFSQLNSGFISHTHKHTHITESSTELLSLKPGVWLAQKFEKLE